MEQPKAVLHHETEIGEAVAAAQQTDLNILQHLARLDECNERLEVVIERLARTLEPVAYKLAEPVDSLVRVHHDPRSPLATTVDGVVNRFETLLDRLDSLSRRIDL